MGCRREHENEGQRRDLVVQLSKREESVASLQARMEEKTRENAALARQLESALGESRHQVTIHFMHFHEIFMKPELLHALNKNFSCKRHTSVYRRSFHRKQKGFSISFHLFVSKSL